MESTYTPPEDVFAEAVFLISKKDQSVIDKFFSLKEQHRSFYNAKQKKRFRDTMSGFSVLRGPYLHELTECFHEFVLDGYITWFDGGPYYIHKPETLKNFSDNKKAKRAARFIVKELEKLLMRTI